MLRQLLKQELTRTISFLLRYCDGKCRGGGAVSLKLENSSSFNGSDSLLFVTPLRFYVFVSLIGQIKTSSSSFCH